MVWLISSDLLFCCDTHSYSAMQLGYLEIMWSFQGLHFCVVRQDLSSFSSHLSRLLRQYSSKNSTRYPLSVRFSHSPLAEKWELCLYSFSSRWRYISLMCLLVCSLSVNLLREKLWKIHSKAFPLRPQMFNYSLLYKFI